MKEQSIILKTYRKEIEVLVLTMEVPTYEPDDEKHRYHPRYEEVLLKLFNNKRENNDILDIKNWYGSNEISIVINLTHYLEDSYNDRQECIEHLIQWFKSGCDISDEDVSLEYGKAYIYEIPTYQNKIESFEGDKYVRHYLEWED